jgi:hypothetical protein
VAAVAIPALVVVALVAPRAIGGDNPAPTSGGPLAGPGRGGGSEATPTATIPAPTGLPGTTGAAPGPTVRPRPEPALPAGPADAARSYVLTADSHDARPGKDHSFLDSYVRARPYVAPSLYALITAPSQRGDYLWATWTRAQATVAVQVLRVAVPDGAPPPTPNTAYVRVQFRQLVTPHLAGGKDSRTDDAVSLVVTKDKSGHWLVTQLLAAS